MSIRRGKPCTHIFNQAEVLSGEGFKEDILLKNKDLTYPFLPTIKNHKKDLDIMESWKRALSKKGEPYVISKTTENKKRPTFTLWALKEA